MWLQVCELPSDSAAVDMPALVVRDESVQSNGLLSPYFLPGVTAGSTLVRTAAGVERVFGVPPGREARFVSAPAGAIAWESAQVVRPPSSCVLRLALSLVWHAALSTSRACARCRG